MSEPSEIVSVERVIAAPPEEIFEILADPDRHHDIDGSGTVVKAKQGSQRLVLGSRFRMAMKVGIPYSMVSTVVELDEPRCIAWQTRGPGNLGGGRIWRYELEPVEGGTLVRESWDISQESVLSKWMVNGLGEKTRENMAATLERIEQRATSGDDDATAERPRRCPSRWRRRPYFGLQAVLGVPPWVGVFASDDVRSWPTSAGACPR